MGIARRQMRRQGIMRTAATASMVSSARTNRAQRKAIEKGNGGTNQPQEEKHDEKK